MRRDGPACLSFSRQNLVCQPRDAQMLRDVERGGYILLDPANAKVEAIVIATGSEVELAMQAARALEGEIGVRVVSMPATSVFDAQPLEYHEGVLPSWWCARVAVEAVHPDYWRRYVGLDGDVIGIATFGASAPAPALFEHFGFTVERVVEALRRVVKS